jgi:hypothetical protein
MRHIFGEQTMSKANFEIYRYAIPLGNNGLTNMDIIRH